MDAEPCLVIFGKGLMSTYRIAVWDHEEELWEPRFVGLSQFAMREPLRSLFDEYWSEASVQICNEQDFPLALQCDSKKTLNEPGPVAQ